MYHSSLTQEQSSQLESVQRVCLATILGDNYVSYEAAREMTGLPLLSARKERRVETFCRRAIVHPRHKNMFPLNIVETDRGVRKRKTFKVNYARTQSYQSSSVIYCQTKLNQLIDQGKLQL